jgi:hypothetical protein
MKCGDSNGRIKAKGFRKHSKQLKTRGRALCDKLPLGYRDLLKTLPAFTATLREWI